MRKKREIHLINIVPGSQGKIDKSHIPLGILYVGSYLKLFGFKVILHHLLPDEIEKSLQKISKSDPLWVGFSVLSGATTYWSAIASDNLKKMRPDILIVWGGHHPSLVAKKCLEESYVDIVVRGEGEVTSLELSECLLKGTFEDLRFVKGISYKLDGEIFENDDRELASDIDSFTLDYSLVDLPYYFSLRDDGVRNISFFSSRGCPYNCAFCSTSKYYGTSYRVHSKEYVLDHMRFLRKKYSVNSVYFSDDNFYLIKKRAQSIIADLRNLDINCDTLDVRLDQLSEEDLLFFSEHKVKGIFFGWESGNDRLLKLIKKRIDTDLILNKVSMIARYNIPSWGSGIMLLPTETFEETLNTIRFSVKLRKILKNSTISVFRFMPLPQTDLTEVAKENGWREPDDQKDWIKIDPIEKEYKVEWIPWITDELDVKFRYVQELSRMGIANYYANKGILSVFHRVISVLINKRFDKLFFRFMFEVKVYRFGVTLYLKLKKGRKGRLLKTKILK